MRLAWRSYRCIRKRRTDHWFQVITNMRADRIASIAIIRELNNTAAFDSPLMKGIQKMSDKMLLRSIAGGVLSLAFAAGYAGTASAADYTAQELANIEVVRGLYTQLDAADSRGDTKTAILWIGNKYISEDYHQEDGGVGRHTFTDLFTGMGMGMGGGAGGRPGGGAGGPPGGGAGGFPGGAGGPPGGATAGGPPGGAGGPPGGGAPGGGRAFQLPGLLAVFGDGDEVVQFTTRNGMPIFNMFSVNKDGFIYKHWPTAGGGFGAPGGAPGGQGGQRGGAQGAPGGAPGGAPAGAPPTTR
jgi:hypothetical protein